MGSVTRFGWNLFTGLISFPANFWFRLILLTPGQVAIILTLSCEQLLEKWHHICKNSWPIKWQLNRFNLISTLSASCCCNFVKCYTGTESQIKKLTSGNCSKRAPTVISRLQSCSRPNDTTFLLTLWEFGYCFLQLSFHNAVILHKCHLIGIFRKGTFS